MYSDSESYAALSNNGHKYMFLSCIVAGEEILKTFEFLKMNLKIFLEFFILVLIPRL